MKKISAALLIVVSLILALSLISCGGNGGGEAEGEGTTVNFGTVSCTIPDGLTKLYSTPSVPDGGVSTTQTTYANISNGAKLIVMTTTSEEEFDLNNPGKYFPKNLAEAEEQLSLSNAGYECQDFTYNRNENSVCVTYTTVDLLGEKTYRTVYYVLNNHTFVVFSFIENDSAKPYANKFQIK